MRNLLSGNIEDTVTHIMKYVSSTIIYKGLIVTWDIWVIISPFEVTFLLFIKGFWTFRNNFYTLWSVYLCKYMYVFLFCSFIRLVGRFMFFRLLKKKNLVPFYSKNLVVRKIFVRFMYKNLSHKTEE